LEVDAAAILFENVCDQRNNSNQSSETKLPLKGVEVRVAP